MQGALAGILGCIFGVIGVFALGFVFVPLAAACAVVGLIRGISGNSAAGIGTSLLAGVLSVFGFFTSPSLWLLAASLLVALQVPPRATPMQRVTSMPPLMQTPTRMPRAAPSNVNPQSGVVQVPGSPAALEQARAQSQMAQAECRNKRLSGDLKTYAASAQCSNPRIIAAYQRAGYRYMDLIVSYTAKRLEISEATDQSRLTEAQGAAELSQFFSGLVERERQRDRGQR
jgi:hypothetical protein